MGCCCGKDETAVQEERRGQQVGEHTPLLYYEQQSTNAHQVVLPIKDESGPNRARYYQSVVDDARRKFISTSSGRTVGYDAGNAEKIRTMLTDVSVDSSMLHQSPIDITDGESGNAASSSNCRKSVTEILNEPLNVDYYEVIADEMAEIVSKHSYNMRVDDSDTAILVLKPGAAAAGSAASGSQTSTS